MRHMASQGNGELMDILSLQYAVVGLSDAYVSE